MGTIYLTCWTRKIQPATLGGTYFAECCFSLFKNCLEHTKYLIITSVPISELEIDAALYHAAGVIITKACAAL